MSAFFIPLPPDQEGKDDPDFIEFVYKRMASRIGTAVPAKHEERVRALTWTHNGRKIKCEVGGTLPSYFGTRDEKVMAIFKTTGCYAICTPSRGGVTGTTLVPVYAGDGFGTHAKYFDPQDEKVAVGEF